MGKLFPVESNFNLVGACFRKESRRDRANGEKLVFGRPAGLSNVRY